MVAFGKKKGRELFYLSEMLYFLNHYIGANGQVHRNTASSTVQLTRLIKFHPDFKYYPSGPYVRTGQWQYIGKLDDSEEE